MREMNVTEQTPKASWLLSRRSDVPSPQETRATKRSHCGVPTATILATLFAHDSVNHRLWSGPDVMSCGHVVGGDNWGWFVANGMANSVCVPDVVSLHPI